MHAKQCGLVVCMAKGKVIGLVCGDHDEVGGAMSATESKLSCRLACLSRGIGRRSVAWASQREPVQASAGEQADKGCFWQRRLGCEKFVDSRLSWLRHICLKGRCRQTGSLGGWAISELCVSGEAFGASAYEQEEGIGVGSFSPLEQVRAQGCSQAEGHTVSSSSLELWSVRP